MAVALPACAAWSLSQGAGGVRPALLAAIAGVIGLDVARTWRLGLLSAERRQMLGALWSAADTSFVAFLPAAAMALFAPSSEAYLAGQVAGGLFALVLFGILFFPPQAQEQEAPSPEASRELLRRLVVFGLPFVGLAVMGWLSNLGERYVIGFMLSPADVGVYAAAYAIASRPVLMGGGIVFAVARPILFAAQAEQNRDKARRVFRLWMALAAIVGIGVVLLLWLFGDLVARLCLAESYRAQAREIFLWVATGHAALLVAQVIELRLLSYGRSAALLVPTCASGLLTIACSSVLLPRLGVVGAPAAKAGAFLVHLAAVAMMLRLARRDTRAEDVAMEAPPKGEAP
jgi:O-antigen/teichoic acid export membrane protein